LKTDWLIKAFFIFP